MKLILTTLLILFSVSLIAQSPQGLNYQAVARTVQGNIIPAQNISVRFSILDGSLNGPVLYQETHTTQTNSFGLFTLAIGKGTPVSGAFISINWGTGDKFLKVEISPQTTSGYQLQGTTQLLSVPYALYSERTRLIAGNAINITGGNTISANYQGGTGINISGSTISGNYVAGTGININGSTISGNYVAGTGINITGNTISATNTTNYWVPDAGGIHSTVPRVGIGVNADNIFPLRVRQQNYGDGRSVAFFESDDLWHSSIAIKSNTSNQEYALVVGGSTNIETRPRNFAIWNQTGLKPGFAIDGFSNNVGIGMTGTFVPQIKSTLHVFSGDVNIEQIGSGIILKSPNGNCWRVTIDNSGNLIRTFISCP